MNRVFITLLVLFIMLGMLPAQEKDSKEFKLSKEEEAILTLTNEAREENKLPALKPSQTLCEVARAHSLNMAKQGKMEHILDGKKPSQRVKEAGYIFKAVGENIAAGTKMKPKKAFELWMGSKPHKENILRGEYLEIGIGIAKDDRGEVYYTQVFGTRLKVR